jgi:hypothetical protein
MKYVQNSTEQANIDGKKIIPLLQLFLNLELISMVHHESISPKFHAQLFVLTSLACTFLAQEY